VIGCPSDAIEELETKAHINIDLCIECGTCEMNCPSGAIIFLDLDELESPE
jgi:heterodisulfide reductase subunit A